MSTYERVTYRPQGTGDKPMRARSVFLQNPRESSMAIPGHGRVSTLVGRQVGRDGESTWAHGDRTQIIQLELIVRREPVEMDLQYGELVPLGTAVQPVQPARQRRARAAARRRRRQETPR